MARTRNPSSWLQSLVLLGICLAIIVGIPAQPARAAIQQNQDLDNALADFDKGSFQLTASANYSTGTPPAGDVAGAVQLAPIAALRSMVSVTSLPSARQDAGIVAVGRNIFVIGGGAPATSATVYVSQVDLSAAGAGGLGTWNTDPSLPAVIHNTAPPTAVAVAERTSPAVAAYVTGQDSGYIYVVGGQVIVSGSTISSYSVLRGTVVAGRVTSWDPLPNLPAVVVVTGAVGLANASAFVAQVNGRTFLYVIGGLQIYRSGASTFREGSRQIIYAELDASGALIGNAWNATQFTIPLNPNPGAVGGIWSSAVVGDAFRDASGLNTNNNFYILGGQTNFSPATYTSAIYRADIASDGTLTMSNASGTGVNNASLGTARSGHAAVQFKGSIYAAGGVVSGSPTQTVLGSYVQTNRTFPELGGPGSSIYFISKNGLPSARSGHGMVVIPDSFSNPTKGFVYAIGGSNGTAPQTTIFRGTISDPSATDVSFPLEGYYVSKPVPFTFAQSRLKKIFWTATIPTGAGIDISFRVSNDATCADLGTRSEAAAPWNSAPGTFNATTNQYEFALNTDPANCFQYRARLAPTNNSDTNATPYLQRLGVVIEIPGATDLTVKSVTPVGTSDALTSLAITLHNENVFLPGEPTLPADFGPNGFGSLQGSFFVDVFVYPPGVTPPATQPYPTVLTAYARLSINVFRNELKAGPNGTGYDFTIPANRALCDYTIAITQDRCVTRTMRDLFPDVGVYKLVVVVDGNNDVDEQPTGVNQAKSNNVFGPVDITITTPPPIGGGSNYVYLPVLVK
ncbi:MAG: hypothetical protein SH847_23735 [Roseiflexaceae bacterium]|nr:hypothetical protein [Roseiflexaceae bacterium]